eukprot:m51a1_g10250 hypothetical protein (349) ;mRNA; r:55749-59924
MPQARGREFALWVHLSASPSSTTAHSEWALLPLGGSAVEWPGFTATLCAPQGDATFLVHRAATSGAGEPRAEHMGKGSLPVAGLAYGAHSSVLLLLPGGQGEAWGSLALDVALPEASYTTTTLHALFAGVNGGPAAGAGLAAGPQRTLLRGAEADAELMSRTVAQYWQQGPHRPLDHDTLVGPHATKEALLRRLWRMANAARRGDVVLFYFSGLGTVVAEEVKLGTRGTVWVHHTSLCPYDAGFGPGANHDAGNVLKPGDVGEPLNHALNKGATAFLVLDCGFVGSPLDELLPLDPADLHIVDFPDVLLGVLNGVVPRGVPLPRSAGAGLRESVSVGLMHNVMPTEVI